MKSLDYCMHEFGKSMINDDSFFASRIADPFFDLGWLAGGQTLLGWPVRATKIDHSTVTSSTGTGY